MNRKTTKSTSQLNGGSGYVAVVVQFEGGVRRLSSTLASVVGQCCNFKHNIVVHSNSRAEEFKLAVEKIEEMPWAYKCRFIHKLSCISYEALLRQLDYEFVLCLQSGAILREGALDGMMAAQKKSGADVVVGSTAQLDANGEIRKEVTSCYLFNSPQLETINQPRNRARISINYYFRSQFKEIKLFRRCLALSGGLPTKIFNLHEFVSEERADQSATRVFYLDQDVLPSQKPPSAPDKDKGSISDRQTDAIDEGKLVWLFGERSSQSAEENGWCFFKHCVEHADEAECFFVLERDVPMPTEVRYHDRIVRKGDVQWSILVESASHFFMTDGITDICLDRHQGEGLENVTHIYLTHGALTYSPGVYQRKHKYFDSVCCSTRIDIEAASKVWGFPVSKFMQTGLARWDELHNFEPKNEILFCPTWRKTLPTQTWKQKENTKNKVEELKDIEYIKRIENVIEDKELHEILRVNHCIMTIRAHFRVKKLIEDVININVDVIRIVDDATDGRTVQQLLKDASLLITDYSSIMWDMAYMNKPVILYQFDKFEMLTERGLVSFAMSDVELMELFDVAHTHEDLMQILKSQMSSRMILSEKHVDRYSRYFPPKDGKNCERILKQIRKRSTHHQMPAPVEVSTEVPLNATKLEQRIAGKKVASIISDYLDFCLSVPNTALEPTDWEQELNNGKYDVMLFEPNLDARNRWAETFFSTAKCSAFLRDLQKFCQANEIELVGLRSPFLRDDVLSPLLRSSEIETLTIHSQAKKCEVDVSIIVPVYNSAEHIKPCLESLTNQDFDGSYEIIVIDDGSKDNSAEIIKNYQCKKAKIRYFFQPNARQGIARNYGIHVAQGEYITFVDADDQLTKNAVSLLYHRAKLDNTELVVALYASYNHEAELYGLNASCAHYLDAPVVSVDGVWGASAFDCSCVAKLISRNSILSHKLYFPGSFHEDEVFTSLLFKNISKYSIEKSVVYIYNSYTNNVSGTKMFSEEKASSIFMIGEFIANSVLQNDSNDDFDRLKLGHLIRRYDRFFQKRIENEFGAVGKQESCKIWSSGVSSNNLERFLRIIPNEIILENAKTFPIPFILKKFSKVDLIERFFNKQFEAVFEYLEDNNIALRVEFDDNGCNYIYRNRYNFYKRQKVQLREEGEKETKEKYYTNKTFTKIRYFKLVKKLLTNPERYFLDSRYGVLRGLSKFFQRQPS